MKTTLTILLIFISLYIFNQNINYQWVKQYKSLSGKLMFDANQNPVFGSYYLDTLFFEGDTLESSGYPDTYGDISGAYLHFNQNGDYIDYARIPYPVVGYAIDSENNHYYAGYYSYPIVLGGDTLISDGGGGHNAFILKNDSSGNYLWHKDIKTGGPYPNFCAHMDDAIVDNEDNLIIIGNGAYLKFDDDTIFTYQSHQFEFIAKYNPSGDLLWVERTGSFYRKFFCDNDNNIFVFGDMDYIDTTIIGNDTLSIDNGSSFLAKYSPGGNLLWYKQFGHTIEDIHASNVDGSVYVLGIVKEDTLFIGMDTLVYPNLPSYPYVSFLAKFNNNGIHQWTQFATSPKIDYAYNSIQTGSENQIFICGDFSDFIKVGDITVNQPYNNMFNGVFLSMIEPDGNVQWVKIYDCDSADTFKNQKIDKNDNLYLIYAPHANDDTLYYNQIEIIRTDNSLLFIKLNAFNTFVDNVEYSDIVSIYPNPTDGIILVKTPGDKLFPTKIEIYDVNGKLIKSIIKHTKEFILDIKNETSGIYFIKFENKNFIEVHKIIKN